MTDQLPQRPADPEQDARNEQHRAELEALHQRSDAWPNDLTDGEYLRFVAKQDEPDGTR